MKRSFKGIWIPSEIWLSTKLTLQEKVFLAEIDSLDNESGCYASNGYFSKFFGLSKNRCSEIIKSIESKGLIKIDYVREKGKSNIEKRVIKVVDKPNRGIRETEGAIRNVEQGYSGKLEENNTSINNTSNNTSNKDIHVREIFDHYLSKNIVQHRKLTNAMRTAINARLRDYSLDDLKKAIDNYDQVIKSDDYWFTHKYPLIDLMREKDITRFLDEADPLNNFRKKGQAQQSSGFEYDPNVDSF